MKIFSNVDLRTYIKARGWLKIDPFQEKRLSETGYRLSIGEHIYKLKYEKSVDVTKKQEFSSKKVTEKGALLKPGELYLIETLERIELSHLYCETTPLQDAARKGLVTIPGEVMKGFKGNLLVSVHVAVPVQVAKGFPFIQLSVEVLEGKDKSRPNYSGTFALPDTKEYPLLTTNLKEEKDGNEDKN